jgi:glycosyltransferase involved in cell wall biosynthesis
LRRYREKVRVVPLGIADPAAGAAGLKLPERFSSFLKGRKLVLSVGRLVLYKGFDYLIGAAAKLDEDAAIVIVGGGPLEADLSRRIVEGGLEDKVLLAGRVAQEDLTALFANASIYAMTSVERSEAFGVVQLEAMAHGLPIVATQIPGSGVGWVSDHGSTGASVPVRDSEALAHALNGLLKQPEKLAECSSASRRRYEEEFRLEHMLSRTLAAMTD